MRISEMLMALADAMLPKTTVQFRKTEQKQCFRKSCDKMHNHNNLYCSAECCKAGKS